MEHRLVTLACVIFPALCQAQAVAVTVVGAQGLSDAAVQRLQTAAAKALTQVSGLEVGDGPGFKRGAPLACADDCGPEVMRAAGTSGAVLLDARAVGRGSDRVAVALTLYLDGERLGVRRGEGTVEGFETAARSALEGLLPAWARKGFGGLRLDVEPGSLVKVDGRVSEAGPGELVALPAGPHYVDVVFPNGSALLQRVEVTAGARSRLVVDAPTLALTTAAPKSGTLRGISYGLWVTGAASVAGGLIAGALARGTGADLSPCTGDARGCATLDDVTRRQAQAESWASTGNIFLGVGAGLMALGAGLFVVDVVTP